MEIIGQIIQKILALCVVGLVLVAIVFSGAMFNKILGRSGYSDGERAVASLRSLQKSVSGGAGLTEYKRRLETAQTDITYAAVRLPKDSNITKDLQASHDAFRQAAKTWEDEGSTLGEKTYTQLTLAEKHCSLAESELKQ